jgi:hypothetical protein
MAAAALFIGTAVPALIHVSNSTGPNADPSIAANASQTQGGTNEGKQAGTGGGSGGSSGKDNDKDKGDKTDKPDKGNGSSGSTAGAQPSASAANVPACTSMQLGSAVRERRLTRRQWRGLRHLPGHQRLRRQLYGLRRRLGRPGSPGCGEPVRDRHGPARHG